MGLKKMSGLTGRLDIKQEPSHPKPDTRLCVCGGVVTPVSPYSKGRTGTGEMGTHWPRLPSTSRLFHTAFPCRLGVGGVLDSFSSPLRSSNRLENGDPGGSSLGGLAQMLHH